MFTSFFQKRLNGFKEIGQGRKKKEKVEGVRKVTRYYMYRTLSPLDLSVSPLYQVSSRRVRVGIYCKNRPIETTPPLFPDGTRNILQIVIMAGDGWSTVVYGPPQLVLTEVCIGLQRTHRFSREHLLVTGKFGNTLTHYIPHQMTPKPMYLYDILWNVNIRLSTFPEKFIVDLRFLYFNFFLYKLLRWKRLYIHIIFSSFISIDFFTQVRV